MTEFVYHANELTVLPFLVSGYRRTTPNVESVLDMKLAKIACRPIDYTRIAPSISSNYRE